jgi:hypothetical protein
MLTLFPWLSNTENPIISLVNWIIKRCKKNFWPKCKKIKRRENFCCYKNETCFPPSTFKGGGWDPAKLFLPPPLSGWHKIIKVCCFPGTFQINFEIAITSPTAWGDGKTSQKKIFNKKSHIVHCWRFFFCVPWLFPRLQEEKQLKK